MIGEWPSQRRDGRVVERAWLPTTLSSSDVLVVDEHLVHVRDRIEDLERR